jgi:hypothetical protein
MPALPVLESRLRQLDDDPRAADVAEPISVFVALRLTNELRAADSQPSDDGVDIVDCDATLRMPGVLRSCRWPRTACQRCAEHLAQPVGLAQPGGAEDIADRGGLGETRTVVGGSAS